MALGSHLGLPGCKYQGAILNPMKENDLRNGQGWVESQLTRLAADLEVAITGITWSRSSADQNREVWTISFKLITRALKKSLQLKTFLTFSVIAKSERESSIV